MLSIVEVSLSHLSVKYALKCLQSAPFCIEIVKIFQGGMPPDPPSGHASSRLRRNDIVHQKQLFPYFLLAPPPSKILDPPLNIVSFLGNSLKSAILHHRPTYLAMFTTAGRSKYIPRSACNASQRAFKQRSFAARTSLCHVVMQRSHPHGKRWRKDHANTLFAGSFMQQGPDCHW